MLVDPTSKTCMQIKAVQSMYAKSLPSMVPTLLQHKELWTGGRESWLWLVRLATVSLILPQSPTPTSTRCLHFRFPSISNPKARITLPHNREGTSPFLTFWPILTHSHIQVGPVKMITICVKSRLYGYMHMAPMCMNYCHISRTYQNDLNFCQNSFDLCWTEKYIWHIH